MRQPDAECHPVHRRDGRQGAYGKQKPGNDQVTFGSPDQRFGNGKNGGQNIWKHRRADSITELPGDDAVTEGEPVALFEELKVLVRVVNAGKRQNGHETNEKGDREQDEKPAVHRHPWPARHCSSLVINDPVHSPVTLEPTVTMFY